MDPLLMKNLESVKGHVHKNWDMCFVVSGIEGAGKSTFAFQLAYYLAGERFTLDHVCMNPEEFMEKIKRPDFLKPGDCLILDEGFIINSRSAMSKLNREFLAILSECRQKQLFLIIICPNFFDLDKNVALWRSRTLFFVDHINLKRGFFKAWGYERKKKLYVLGKKFFEYHKVKYDMRGVFNKFMPIDEEAYKARKALSFQRKQEASPKDIAFIEQRNLFITILHELGLGWVEMSRLAAEKGHIIPVTTLRGGMVRFLSKKPTLLSRHTKERVEKDGLAPLPEEEEIQGQGQGKDI